MLKGCNYLGKEESSKGNVFFKAFNPKKGITLECDFYQASENEIDKATQLSEQSFKILKMKSTSEKANFLGIVSEMLIFEKEKIIERCMEETALPFQRLEGEMGRTVNQIKMFAELLNNGSYCNAKIDTAVNDRLPVRKPDLRQMLIPIGPVAVFGASNFPLAFSVAGGDTISALAAGCPVIVKAHPSHPGTSELVAKVILSAVEKCDFPNGTFSMIHGIDNEISEFLVKSKRIKAVGFTGSFQGGKALFDLAMNREEPIPIYAEMGSVNPIVIFPNRLKEEINEIVEGLANSVVLGVGQFCTNPGLIFLLKSQETEFFLECFKNKISKIKPGTMLSENIACNFRQKINSLESKSHMLAKGEEKANENQVGAYLFNTNYKDFINNKELQEEVFGPSTIIVVLENENELETALNNLKGQLTITFQGTNEELKSNSNLIEIAIEKAGRLIINGFPTGVEVCHSMHHGGPYPATTNIKSTSVGTESINRFLKPICFQDFPENLLPPELKNSNPLEILRQVNGEYTGEVIGDL